LYKHYYNRCTGHASTPAEKNVCKTYQLKCSEDEDSVLLELGEKDKAGTFATMRVPKRSVANIINTSADDMLFSQVSYSVCGSYVAMTRGTMVIAMNDHLLEYLLVSIYRSYKVTLLS
jgi:hypothetical protein